MRQGCGTNFNAGIFVEYIPVRREVMRMKDRIVIVKQGVGKKPLAMGNCCSGTAMAKFK